jgi:hypothetical protein
MDLSKAFCKSVHEIPASGVAKFALDTSGVLQICMQVNDFI